MEGLGARAYLAVSGGGFKVAKYLSSGATFPAGKLGGHQGRTLRSGDTLALVNPSPQDSTDLRLPPELIPTYTKSWRIGVLPGPQVQPDYFLDEDIQTFYNSDYIVHHNSNRLGVRLVGPKPTFSRPDGGEGGSHPSNLHDNVYAVGSINFTGDMPIILLPDGPSLGGFVCPATIAVGELWKVGQLSPGDHVRFVPIDSDTALQIRTRIDFAIQSPSKTPSWSIDTPIEASGSTPAEVEAVLNSAIIWKQAAESDHPEILYRQAGDTNILIEYGPMELDLDLRFRVSYVEGLVRELKKPGILQTAPGVRTLQINYDSRVLKREDLLELMQKIENQVPPVKQMQIPIRRLRLPLSFEDNKTKAAIAQYSSRIRSDAPYLPSNVDFLAHNNGLPNSEAVQSIVMSATYMVLGLGM